MTTLLLRTARPYVHGGRDLSIPGAVFIESRPVVQLIFLMRATATSGIIYRPSIHSLLGILSWSLITIAIYVFNGVTDLATDRANQSARPIASGLLSKRVALTWSAALAGGGLSVCWYVSPVEFGLAAAMLGLGWAYSAGPSLKNNATGFAVVIGLGAALTYTAGWVIGGRPTTHILVLALLVSFWVGVCCASKDFSDVEGDRLVGRHTWPVVFGPRRAAQLLATLAIVAAGLILSVALKTGTNALPPAILLIGSGMLAFTVYRSAAAPAREMRRRPYRMFVATQYATNGAMLIAGTI